MVFNISSITNVTPYSFNTTLINDSSEIAANAVSQTDTITGGYYGMILWTILYLFIFMLSFSEAGPFRYDFLQANIIASGLNFALFTFLVILKFVNDFTPISLSGLLLFVFLYGIYLRKRRGG